MQDIANGMNSSIRILAASIRNVKSMGGLMAHGLDTSTFSPDIVRDLFCEELTICAAEDFEAAAKRGGADNCMTSMLSS
jgi:hypothetical protein